MPKWTASLYPARWLPRRSSSWATTSARSTCCATSSPRHFRTGGFDSRWGMLGRVRPAAGGGLRAAGPALRGAGGVPPGAAPSGRAPTSPSSRSSARPSRGWLGWARPERRSRKPVLPVTFVFRWPSVMVAGWPQGRLEESPSSTRADCQVTPGRRKATDRATENRPPGPAGNRRVRVKRWGKSPPRRWQQRRHGNPQSEQGQISGEV